MKQNLFENLPSEITLNILLRLPVPSVACCKCVCKPWLHLVETREFGKSYLSKSVPNLLVLEHLEHSKLCTIFEFEDGLDLERHQLHYNPIAKFSLTYRGNIHGSVDGLLFICDEDLKPDGFFICNPITRDYIKLNSPPHEFAHVVAYGFGVSKISGEYKVVRISLGECQVYTLGTGFWRKIIAPPDRFYFIHDPSSVVTHNPGAFLNGILHWPILDVNCRPHVSCFDLETETFSRLSCPIPVPDRSALCVLGDSLCLCDASSYDEIVIWSVKECGDEKIWEKVLVMCKTPPEVLPTLSMIELLYPLKVFKDGDVLLKLDACLLLYYSEKDKSLASDMLRSRHELIIHTPSFLSLKRFDMENVSTLWFCAP